MVASRHQSWRRAAWLGAGLALFASGHAPAGPVAIAPDVRLAYVATPHAIDPTASEVRWVALGASGARVERSVTVPHAPGAVVRGALIPGTDVAILAADDDGARDREFGATLYRADASGLKQLATGPVEICLKASRCARA